MSSRPSQTQTGRDEDEDILIGGTTSLTPAAITAVMSEWTSNKAYADRVTHLRTGTGGANGSTKLDTMSVQNDSAADTLSGDSGLDWFFLSADDVLVDFNAGLGEIKNAI
jgi:hypothetical protein